jgi:hypothetical protein
MGSLQLQRFGGLEMKKGEGERNKDFISSRRLFFFFFFSYPSGGVIS